MAAVKNTTPNNSGQYIIRIYKPMGETRILATRPNMVKTALYSLCLNNYSRNIDMLHATVSYVDMQVY